MAIVYRIKRLGSNLTKRVDEAKQLTTQLTEDITTANNRIETLENPE